jgi:ferredoxin
MIDLTIDGKSVQAENGATVMEAAGQLGIVIPSMCHNGDLPHFTSCMVCLVKDAGGRLFPSCSVKAVNGMQITTFDEEIREARKTALDLLLSDHVGDCEAPCQLSCPAHMDIPQMNRHLAEGDFDLAYEVVIRDIAIPSILGRICPAPCESACRRRTIDGAVGICLLKRAAGDEGRPTADRGRQTADGGLRSAVSGHIAVIGSGPHGLSAAWYLRMKGYQVTIFDRNELPGGELRYSVPREKLPEEVLDREIGRIRDSGVIFIMNSDMGPVQLVELHREFDAVVEPLDKAPKMAIRASALGKDAAIRVDQQLTGRPVTGERRLFNSRFGRLTPEENLEYLKESPAADRLEPAQGIHAGYTREEVMAEAARCMHCDCRKLGNCRLRDYSDEYQADQKRFQGPERKPLVKVIQHDTVIYEPEKCIKCGICVRITSEYKEELGLTFIGRGFDVKIGVPFSESLKSGLTHTAIKAAEACPTGALSLKAKEKRRKAKERVKIKERDQDG